MLDGARQSFQFFREITWFLRNNRALPKFRYQILHLWWPKAAELSLKKKIIIKKIMYDQIL